MCTLGGKLPLRVFCFQNRCFESRILALIAFGFRETPQLVGARARKARLMVFFLWQSYRKND